MSRSVSTCLLASSLVLALSGCGWFEFEEREEWRVQAEAACMARDAVRPTAYMSQRPRLDGPGVCGIDHPLRITALLDGQVRLKQEATLGCPATAATEAWLSEIVQPAARLYFGAPVVEIDSGSYACRTRNHKRGAPLSEHAFGNAVDVMSFTLADGRRITVAQGWRGAPAERDFLRETFVGACDRFTTVLGPGSDAHHDDHFHLDLARHDARGERRYCRPRVEFASRLGETTAPPGAPPPPFAPSLPASASLGRGAPIGVSTGAATGPSPPGLTPPAPVGGGRLY